MPLFGSVAAKAVNHVSEIAMYASPCKCRELFPLTIDAAYLDTGSARLAFTCQERATARFDVDRSAEALGLLKRQ